MMMRPFSFLVFSLFLCCSFFIRSFAQEYVLIGWNDLGMHCSNKDFAKIAVLPPYNNISAQLVLKLPNQTPQIVTSGYTIEYSIPNNTYSDGKTNFWTYAQQLFGLPAPLPPNIGLTGKGLTGTLDSSGNYFAAHGIPITPFPDSDLVNESPFQLIHLVAKDKTDGSVLATTDVVIPVSNEVGCVQSGCHSSATAILNAHADVTGFNRSGPVLCASCHASNALGTTGTTEAGPFSFRIHERHSSIAGPANDINTCYKCHPGPNTQCLRDIMGKNPVNPMICQNCHGTMAEVAASVDAGRRPWLDEPKCGDCHGSTHAENTGKLYRQSTGHGGLFCSACHGSPHAILPTIQANDNLQNIRLQGYDGTLRKCSVCHATPPSGTGPHGIVDTTSYQAAVPILVSPLNSVMGITTSPQLHWNPAAYAQSYNVQVSVDSEFASISVNESLLTQTSIDLSGLSGSVKYYWHVRSKNSTGYSFWSEVWHFTTATGSTFSYIVGTNWNMISLPLLVDNTSVNVQYPSAVSDLFGYDAINGYQAKDSLVNGGGYWLKFSATQTINITGVPILSDTIDVADGWNIIGSISDSVSVAGLITEPADIVSSSFFDYNKSYEISDFIVPGKAYWVKINGGGKIILNSTSGAIARSTFYKVHDFLQTCDSILIRDAKGRQQVLYISDRLEGGISESMFEMPPLPPDDIFDVRFSSNRMLELYNYGCNSEFPIRISSAEYPLTVTWDFNKTDNIFLTAGVNEIQMQGSGSAIINNRDENMKVKVSASAGIPSEFTLEQNYPNPFNPTTIFKFGLPEKSYVRLSIVDMLGQTVQILVNGQYDAGIHEVKWSAQVASGIYFYRIEASSTLDASKTFSQVRKMLVMK